MILFVTSAPNDNDLAKTLGSCVIRCPVPSDICFWGAGDNDTVLKIACERKKPGDLANCILDGRLMHQAQIAKEEGIDVYVVVVEGRTRSNPDDGLLEIVTWGINPRTMHRAEMWQPVKPTITYSRFDQFLTELDYLAGVIVKRSDNVQETASIIKALWDNFQTPPSKHNSLHKIFEQPIGSVQLVRPSLLRRISKELSGIGWGRSKEVSEYFKSVRDMVNADPKQWQEIEGIGKKTADKVVQEINNEH
jgi:ERCC4-type nuclease